MSAHELIKKEIFDHQSDIGEIKHQITLYRKDIEKYCSDLNEKNSRYMADTASQIVRYYEKLKTIEELVNLKKGLLPSPESND